MQLLMPPLIRSLALFTHNIFLVSELLPVIISLLESIDRVCVKLLKVNT